MTSPLLLTAIIARELPGSVFFSDQAFEDFAPTARLEYEAITDYRNSDRTDADKFLLQCALDDLDWPEAAIAAIVASPNADHTSGLYDPPAGWLQAA